MRLVLKNDSDSQGDFSLSGKAILAGHDPSECQLVWARERWPTVSRLHAEFRVVHGVCYLTDLDSESGTYVDGRRITQAIPVRIGSRIQFGHNGPQVSVLRVELVDSIPAPAGTGAEVAAPPRAGGLHGGAGKIVLPPSAQRKRTPPKAAHLEIEGDHAVNVRRLELTKDVTRFGRAPKLDIVFDVAATYVSRTHAEVQRSPDGYVLSDLNSFNGTLLNNQRITGPRLLADGDTIRLGQRGPVLRFRQTGLRLPASPQPLPPTPERAARYEPTTPYVGPGGMAAGTPPQLETDDREPILVLSLRGKATYSIGRAPDSDVQLDGLQISKRHANLVVEGTQVVIEDNHSTNGVYVNGRRLVGRAAIGRHDIIQIGPFLLRADVRRGLEVFDTRSRVRIDSIGLTKVVPSNAGGGTIKLLDGITLTIQPNEFVGLLGPSGAGKSTLIDALNGTRPATAGQVLINNLDLYQHLNGLKQSIGYVPQDDIIHRELTVYRTLYYVARLRLSQDVSASEVEVLVNEVTDVTGLTERRHVPVAQLSGGQRKRVSVAVELLTKPSTIFLDEPTSGLDPGTEEKIMVLFRQIADSGHTVVLTTHAMENVKLFDKIVVMMQGKLVFYGTPGEALHYVKAKSFKELYDKLEEPVAQHLADAPRLPADASAEQQNEHKAQLAHIREKVAEDWRQKFESTPQYEHNVREPQRKLPQLKPAPVPKPQRATFRNGLLQWRILCRRYGEVLRHDKSNLLILFGQAPIIAFLTWLAVANTSPRDFLYFIISLVPVWFGTSIAAREVIRERAIYNRERMVNLGLLAYVGSKIGVLTLIISLQCLLMLGTLKVFAAMGVLKLPTQYGGLPQLLVMILTGMVGIALGLLVSASVKTSEMATSIVPLLLIPQILFSGLVGVPQGVTKVAGALMPATWSFDEMKRLSSAEVKALRGKGDGAEPAFGRGGRGLYKQVEDENDITVEDRERKMQDYKAGQEDKVEQFRKDMEDYQRKLAAGARTARRPDSVELDPPPAKPKIRLVPDDLSDYVDFLHPWGAVWLNPLILFLMFFCLSAVTIGVLRAQDAK
jgi:ABC-type multidrug transport system ATPase subunit/pSer/pThr/pTyr-binding forkhead associated (FHA) protein